MKIEVRSFKKIIESEIVDMKTRELMDSPNSDWVPVTGRASLQESSLVNQQELRAKQNSLGHCKNQTSYIKNS